MQLEDTHIDKQLIRIDQITGCLNLIAFSEKIYELCKNPIKVPYSLVVIDVNGLGMLNKTKGYSTGSDTLRWIALLASTELDSEIYRIGGDEFVALLLNDGGQEKDDEIAHRLFDLLNQRAEDFGLQRPITTVSIIHYSGNEQNNPGDFFVKIYSAIRNTKSEANRTIKSFQVEQISSVVYEWQLNRLAENFVDRLVSLGTMLENSLLMAYTDPVSNLPNQREAQDKIEKRLALEEKRNLPFCLLFIDGDDLRKFNKISYSHGDEVIKQLGIVIKQTIRPEDFIARWRVGDEFLVFIEGTNRLQGQIIGERICDAVRQPQSDGNCLSRFPLG